MKFTITLEDEDEANYTTLIVADAPMQLDDPRTGAEVAVARFIGSLRDDIVSGQVRNEATGEMVDLGFKPQTRETRERV